MDIIKVKGIVLKKKDIGETMRVLTIFTKEFGKIKANIYGAKSNKNSNKITYSPLNIAEFNIKRNKEYFNIIDSDLIKNYKKILKNIDKIEISLYILDSIDKVYDINIEEDTFYDKIIEILNYIENIDIIEQEYKYYIILSFLRRIMIEQGIYDLEELTQNIETPLIRVYNEIISLNKTNANEKIQIMYKQYKSSLKELIKKFEDFINNHLQVKLEIKKFIIEEF